MAILHVICNIYYSQAIHETSKNQQTKLECITFGPGIIHLRKKLNIRIEDSYLFTCYPFNNEAKVYSISASF